MYKSEQLALSLKHLIESGFWKPHDKLPSLRQQAEASTRRNLLGSGDRSDRNRTYNFPQGRVTDQIGRAHV